MNVDEHTRLKRTLELTGLNDKQVEHILRDVKSIVDTALYRAKQGVLTRGGDE